MGEFGMRQRNVRSLAFSLLVLASLLSLCSLRARADSGKKGVGKEGFAGYTKYLWFHDRYEVNADGTHVEKVEWAQKVLTDQGISEANETSISLSDRLETAEILSAYTLKKDGRKINVPPTNFQDETNTGKGDAAPMFSDIRTKTVAFPDVAVGDTVVISYKLTQKEATFPGNFSMQESFSKFEVYDDVQISLSAPSSLHVQVFSRGVQGGEAPSTDGRRNWAWTYRNQQLSTPEVGAVSELDYGPLIVATTFKDYGALAAAYDSRAKAKSQPTDQVRKLAAQLTASVHTPREQSRTLYEWVSRNIKFAGNCVGVGTVVPHAVDVVLANKMGDCKDHTALLQALLAAKGIASTPVLINSGSVFTLPPAAAIGAFDHVINYIPSLDLYADSTSEYTPFGLLPFADSDKPAIHTADFQGIRHTPPVDWRANGTHSTTVLRIHPDGSADGQTKIESKGSASESMRYMMSYLQPNMEDALMRRWLAATGYTGSGTIIKDDPKDLTATYNYGAKYKLSDAMNLPGPGAMYLRSPFEGTSRISGALREVNEPDRTVNFLCMGGYSQEDLTIYLPDHVKVNLMPKNIELRGKYETYKATYQLKGNIITVMRSLEDRTARQVCAPAVSAEYKSFALSMKKNLRQQAIYE
jgi:transglutaminase-like putative cysteine protease